MRTSMLSFKVEILQFFHNLILRLLNSLIFNIGTTLGTYLVLKNLTQQPWSSQLGRYLSKRCEVQLLGYLRYN